MQDIFSNYPAEAVISEFGTPSIKCHVIRKVEGSLVKLLMTDLNLGRGESEVIALSKDTGVRIIVDDLKARKIAETLGLETLPGLSASCSKPRSWI